mmetsp:Transcript_42499/g.128968  ORF Transcript_42499/g.128968 Transcript_42499/m.128968 type:complete len:127 (+) Transcript_42499:664-1044(+)
MLNLTSTSLYLLLAFCYECLPPLVSRLAMDERVRFINFWNALKKVEFLSDETKGNQDIARWAFNVVQTRSFSRDGVARIVPMADMVSIRRECFGFFVCMHTQRFKLIFLSCLIRPKCMSSTVQPWN